MVVLPEPLSADEAQCFASLHGEADAVDGLDLSNLALKDDAGHHGEVHLDVVDFEEDVLGRRRRGRSRGGLGHAFACTSSMGPNSCPFQHA